MGWVVCFVGVGVATCVEVVVADVLDEGFRVLVARPGDVTAFAFNEGEPLGVVEPKGEGVCGEVVGS